MPQSFEALGYQPQPVYFEPAAQCKCTQLVLGDPCFPALNSKVVQRGLPVAFLAACEHADHYRQFGVVGLELPQWQPATCKVQEAVGGRL